MKKLWWVFIGDPEAPAWVHFCLVLTWFLLADLRYHKFGIDFGFCIYMCLGSVRLGILLARS